MPADSDPKETKLLYLEEFGYYAKKWEEYSEWFTGYCKGREQDIMHSENNIGYSSLKQENNDPYVYATWVQDHDKEGKKWEEIYAEYKNRFEEFMKFCNRNTEAV
jgi:hypothetical protein